MIQMSIDEKVTMIKTMLKLSGSQEDARIMAYLNAAEREIIGWRYSYSTLDVEALPPEYDMTQVHAVLAGYTQAGAEGQRTHNENGVEITFSYADMVDYIRTNVIPLCRVL